jgi:hypothetical protein
MGEDAGGFTIGVQDFQRGTHQDEANTGDGDRMG